eukprot:scaffold219565_cov39-Tisochrysis_lutea.AAC.1
MLLPARSAPLQHREREIAATSSQCEQLPFSSLRLYLRTLYYSTLNTGVLYYTLPPVSNNQYSSSTLQVPQI